MKKIILHWTAGSAVPNSLDKESYHFLVDSTGVVHLGKFKPEANIHCKEGMYAKHTGGGNTSSIGVAMCAMFGFKNKHNIGNFPITRKQFEATMQLCADLAIKYKIPVKPETIFTHYEFGLKNPKTSSAGKIDISFLPPYSWVEKNDIGTFIRSKIRWYVAQSTKNKE